VELRKTDAALTEVRANLAKLRAGATSYELDLARAGVTRATDRLHFAESTARRVSALAQVSGVTQQEVDSAQEEVTAATNDLAEARGRLAVLEHGSRPEDIDALQAQIGQLEAQRAYLQGQMDLAAVVSDVDGTVATPERDLRAMKGKLVAKGDLIARIFQFHTVVAQIVIPEQEIADIRVGQPVVLRARAYPERTFRGQVTAVAPVAQGASADQPVVASNASSPIQSLPVQAFLVSTAIENDSLLLRPGMTGQVKVIGAEHRIIGLIARRLARVFRVEVWSWW
jgi:multidrug resistance efflux pump